MVQTRKHQSHIIMKKGYFSKWQCGISSVHNSHVFPMTTGHENMTVLSEESVPLSRRVQMLSLLSHTPHAVTK